MEFKKKTISDRIKANENHTSFTGTGLMNNHRSQSFSEAHICNVLEMLKRGYASDKRKNWIIVVAEV